MKIGKLVKQHIKEIFFYCDNVKHEEIDLLLDKNYSKNTFGINFPFCIELEKISPRESMRYWTEIYLVRGKRIRVTSQWFETSEQLFIRYLKLKGIAEIELPEKISNESAIITILPIRGIWSPLRPLGYPPPSTRS